MGTVPAPTAADLEAIGAALLNMAAATVRLGHSTPAETLDYVSGLELLPDDFSAAPCIVRDFTAWATRREDVVPGAHKRLLAWLRACGWTDDVRLDDLVSTTESRSAAGTPARRRRRRPAA